MFVDPFEAINKMFDEHVEAHVQVGKAIEDYDTIELAKHIIAIEEGFREKPYLCSERYLTIGYGTKLCNIKNVNPLDYPITVNEEQARIWLDDTVRVDDMHLQSTRGVTYIGLSPVRKAILLSMCYQMGLVGLLKFHATWKAIDSRKFNSAAVQMLGSRWAGQTPARAQRHADTMRTGLLPAFYER